MGFPLSAVQSMSSPTQAQFSPARGGCRKINWAAALPGLGLLSLWRLEGDLPSLICPHSQTSAAPFLPQRSPHPSP